MTWLKYYRDNYYDLLNPQVSGAKRGLTEGLYQRAHGFNLVFAHLESLNQSEYHIIETGTMRNPGNWKDGQSARLFTEFVEHHGGTVRSVDIDPTLWRLPAVLSRPSALKAHVRIVCFI